MIKLTRSEPSKNMHRFYALHLAPTLFGEWSLISEWGRIGSAGKVMHRTFEIEALAESAFAKRLKVKNETGIRARVTGLKPARQKKTFYRELKELRSTDDMPSTRG
jgi:predicted DNA-binding WGR domain protein